jgi:hypothetical protein
MKRLAAITLILLAPGLLTFAVALGCMYSMPACHMTASQHLGSHPCCAKNPAASHNVAVRYASFEIAPPVMEWRGGATLPIAAPSTGDAVASSFASPPHTPLRV